ncbi:MAG TPA: hypothetical protein VKP60_01755 [Magnetospirillaceae bacterium]|nr:hypothetical protein [Magnetospirillaceae bacterium]
MRRQPIDFAPASASRLLEETGPAARLAAMAGLLLCLVAFWQAQRTLTAIDAAEEEIAGVHGELDQRIRQKRAPVESGLGEDQAAAVNAAIRQLNLPWRDVLDAVEAGTPPSLELLALEPDAKRSVIRIEAETADSEHMLAAVEQMKGQPFLAGVFLTRHAVEETDPHHALRLQIEAAWRGAAP